MLAILIGGAVSHAAAQVAQAVPVSATMSFDDIPPGPVGAGPMSVTTQYAGYGVTYSNAFLVDLADRNIPGGSRAISACANYEECQGTITLHFDPPVQSVTFVARATGVERQVRLAAFAADNTQLVIGADGEPRAIPMGTPDTVSVSQPTDSIATLTIETTVYRGFLAIDDVAFERAPPIEIPPPPRPDRTSMVVVAGVALILALGGGGLWQRSRMRAHARARVSSHLDRAIEPTIAMPDGGDGIGIRAILKKPIAPGPGTVRIVPDGEEDG